MEGLELYKKITEIAALQFKLEEVALIVEAPATIFDDDPAALRAFLVGRLQAQAEVRKAMLQMAKQGSTPAQKEFSKLSEESGVEFEGC